MPITNLGRREETGQIGVTPSGGVNSPLHDQKLQVGLSTQIIIEAQGADGQFHTIGAIQNLTPTETRPLQRIGEVGTDAVIEITPTSFTTVTMEVTRIVFDYQRLPAAFQRGFRHIHAQRVPFDIQVKDYNPYWEISTTPGTAVNFMLTTRYVNCWLARYSTPFTADNYIITETATIEAEHVFDEPIGSQIATGGDDATERSHNDSRYANTLAEAFITPPLPGAAP